MIDAQLADMRRAQFQIAEELAARGWPEVNYAEVVGYPSPGDQFLAVVDLTAEMHGEIRIRFATPFRVNVDDDDEMRRLNLFFWRGCKTRVFSFVR